MEKTITNWDIVNWKVLLLLIFVYLLINSDLFIDNVLSRIGGTMNGDSIAAYGTIIQSLILGCSYLVFQPLATYDYI